MSVSGDSQDFLIWTAVATVGALFCLFRTRKTFKNLRLIEDMPTSLIRSASQGFTELVGVGRLLSEPLTSPLTALPCLWWSYNIERYKKGSDNNAGTWVSVERRTSKVPFNIDDGTGLCQIFPDGAELTSRHKQQWYGSSRNASPILLSSIIPSSILPNKTSSLKVFSGGLKLGGFGRRYRFTEQLIIDGDPLYVLGHFETDATGHRTLALSKIRGDILTHWKQDFGALLEEYDHNGDGELCLKEWKQVRSAAEKAALKQQGKYSALPAAHSIRKPDAGGLPFIIGGTEQKKLTRSLRTQSIVFALGFLGLGATAVWFWSNYLSS